MVDSERVVLGGPHRHQDPTEDEAGQSKGGVEPQHVFGKAGEHDETGDGCQDGGECSNLEVEHAGQEAGLLAEAQIGLPEVGVGAQSRGTQRPTVLLAEERLELVGANSLGKVQGNVLELPAVVNYCKARVDVLAEANLSSAAERYKRLSAVDCACPDAHGAAKGVARNLDETVEQFLDGSSSALNPSLVGANLEELGGLHNRDLAVMGKVGHDFLEVVRARTEVSIEDGKEGGSCLGECVAKVASLFHVVVFTGNVIEAKPLGEIPDLGVFLVIEDIDSLGGPV
ncbi:hypothetical protein ATCV1_z179R [Acanthocystis turfacea chlorella virus 1]|uniref:Uncharacterized protein z179R n=1 Tax=Chlorovirus heliozoae TaxID=322019 RepID=A7K8D9_9PHYC|nr:hypothetical protein ATCV1_z179R [Acanthocystis turfacea chlorella virus 1]ABT16313.1 hypothetical protein ATCV1_z179R [Acanthocystis turfacea chlorella virus 1]